MSGARALHWLWPRTLRVRIFLILFAGLTAAYGLSYSVLSTERYMSAKAVMLGTLESDVATSINILDRSPPEDRSWLAEWLGRRSYQFIIGPGSKGVTETSERGREIVARIQEAAGRRFPVEIRSIPGERERLQAHLTLSDGSPLTIAITPHGIMPVAEWLPWVLIAQLVLLVLCAWIVVRQALRPLGALAAAADALDPTESGTDLSETGPSEVAHAARAFNAMRRRIAGYLQERVQILAAISHDLQTPITRMRLRADMAPDSVERDKLVRDLREIESLVQDGIAYARSAHGSEEKTARIDLSSFVDSLACDYQDTGKEVSVFALAGGVVSTRPHALRRILANFVDNALKFAGTAEIGIERGAAGDTLITVRDRGPGIPEEMLGAVMQPFVRLEESRSRDTGGTGLGLAIAAQLAGSIGGTVRLYNRADGGLAAEVALP